VSQGIQARLAIRRGGFELDVDLNLPGQGITGLFGASGSGKTTLLRCIAGLERARGTLRVNGEIWQDPQQFLPVHQRPLAYVFQEASLFPHLDVRGNLEYGWRRLAPAARQIGFDDAVDWLGLAPLLARRPAGLSGGERQRVAIARALLTSPRLLLMDEPLSALDFRSKGEILPYLEKLHARLAIPVLYVTHSPHEVARLADHLVVLDAGRVQAVGETAELLTALDLPLAGYDRASALLQGTVQDHDATWHLTRVGTDAWHIAVPREDLAVGQPARIQIQASDVSLALQPHTDTSILNILPARVDAIRDINPAQLLVRLQLDDGQTLLARITRRSGDVLGLQPGQRLYAQIKSVALVG
jgi:molybdate transport system ATP-binding protein